MTMAELEQRFATFEAEVQRLKATSSLPTRPAPNGYSLTKADSRMNPASRRSLGWDGITGDRCDRDS